MKQIFDFSLYTNQWDCLLNVPFSGIIIIIIIIIYYFFYRKHLEQKAA